MTGLRCGRNGRRRGRRGIEEAISGEFNIGDEVKFYFSNPVNEKFELTGKEIKIPSGTYKGNVVLGKSWGMSGKVVIQLNRVIHQPLPISWLVKRGQLLLA